MDDITGDDIALIEARIEELNEAIERCRKFGLAARIAIGAGAVWAMLTLIGLVPSYPSTVVGSLAAVIGGIVLLGSNATTWTQHEEALAKAEALRREMIGHIEMRVVEPARRTLH